MSPREPRQANNGRFQEETSLIATADMCFHCFDALVISLCSRKQSRSRCHWNPDSTAVDERNALDRDTSNYPTPAVCPLFVTWERNNRLRGCIGTLTAKPLSTSLSDYALNSALRDHRFDPIQWHELSQLQVSVSLLVDYETCQHATDWVVGRHGILIRFLVNAQEYSATYLPEVVVQQKWDQAEAVISLVKKAGYAGSLTPDFLKRIKCTRYQSSKQKVSFAEYVNYLEQRNDPLLDLLQDDQATCTNL